LNQATWNFDYSDYQAGLLPGTYKVTYEVSLTNPDDPLQVITE